MKCGRCQPGWRNSIAKRKSAGNCATKSRKADFLFFRRVGGRELDQDDTQFGREWLEGVKKGDQLRAAIAQPTQVGNFAGQLAGKTKVRRRHLHPAPRDCFRGRAVKSRVDFDCRKITRINLKPPIRWPTLWIKHAAPLVEAPGTGANPDFLLLDQVQNGGRSPGGNPSAGALISVSELSASSRFFRATFPRPAGVAQLDGASIVHYPATSDELSNSSSSLVRGCLCRFPGAEPCPSHF